MSDESDALKARLVADYDEVIFANPDILDQDTSGLPLAAQQLAAMLKAQLRLLRDPTDRGGMDALDEMFDDEPDLDDLFALTCGMILSLLYNLDIKAGPEAVDKVLDDLIAEAAEMGRQQ